MYPYTALNLKEQKDQKLEDFLNASKTYNASHLLSFSMSENNTFFRVCKLPKGPTATFKVNHFTLASDIISTHSIGQSANTSPLLVMSGFGKDDHKASEAARTISILLQSVFPPINIHSINLEQCKRVVLFNLIKGEGPIQLEFRHYEITTH